MSISNYPRIYTLLSSLPSVTSGGFMTRINGKSIGSDWGSFKIKMKIGAWVSEIGNHL